MKKVMYIPDFHAPVLQENICADLQIDVVLSFTQQVKQADVLILSVHLYSQNYHQIQCPVIAFGESDFFSLAVSIGCTAYLKTPWEWIEAAFCVKNYVPEINNYIGEIKYLPNRLEKEEKFIALNFYEDKLMRIFLLRRGHCLKRKDLEQLLWNTNLENSRALDKHVANLRQKIACFQESETRGQNILTIKNQGYILPL